MKALDLFCCAGGSAKGLDDSGFEVTGIDIDEQPEYPFNFIKQDVFDIDPTWIKDNFDFIWASPKCQKFSWGTPKKNKQEKYVNQIPQTRELLKKTGLPFVIENVLHAPLRKDLLLCGQMFNLNVIRHRIFEIEGFKINQPRHYKHKKASNVPPEKLRNLPEGLIIEPTPIHKSKTSVYACVSGHGGDSFTFKLKDWQKAMGIDWITDKDYLTEAIPPTYSKFIGKTYFEQIKVIA